MTRLWDKGAPLDARVLAYTAGDDYLLDERLVPYDVQASLAHARMLHDQQLLSAQDLAAITAGLTELGQAHARGEWRIELADEDGQTALEARLTQKIGEAGARIHLGRSRNDQVLTALRLYLREATRELAAGALRVADALEELAAREHATVLPGYTHMQQAMPSSVPLWAGGFAAEIRDDAANLEGVLRRLGRNPLGSAAGYGAPGLPLDRDATTRAMGFDSTQSPVTAVQLSRGKAEAQLLFELSLLCQDLGRMAADLLLFYTQEFAFISLPDAFTTGSSIMPQKRNPDAAELIRAKAGRILGSLVNLTVVMKGLPLAYGKDMQEDKPPVFEAFDALDLSLAAMTGMIADLTPNRAAMAAAAGQGFSTATDMADWLVRTLNMPFREAHHVTGRAVARAEALGLDLQALPLAELQALDARITENLRAVLAPADSIASRSSLGGTAPREVRRQISLWKARLAP